jgi:hypothetical protein
MINAAKAQRSRSEPQHFIDWEPLTVLVLLFRHHDAHALGTARLMGELVSHANVSAISGNVSAISQVCEGIRSLG